MSKLQELINKLCPNGVEYKELTNTIEVSTGKQLNRTLLTENGEYPVMNGGINPSGYWNEFNSEENTIIISQGGASAGYVNFMTKKFWAGAHCYIVKLLNEELNYKYIYYFLKNSEEKLLNSKVGAGIPSLNKEKIYKLKIPVPPIEVQDEIVKILDNFTNLQAELQAELVRRIKQYEHVRNVLLTDKKIEKDIVELGKLCNRLQGIPITANEMKQIENEDGEIKIFAGGKTAVNACLEDIPKKENIIYTPSIVVQSRGIIDFIYCDKPHTFKREMWAYTHENEITLKYVYYYLKNSVYKFREVGERMGSMPQISLDITEKFKINLPPIHIQEKVVYVLDNFEKVCKDLNIGLPAEIKERQKQYEFYRNLLLTFPNGIETILKKERKNERDN